MLPDRITDRQWSDFQERGYLHLGRAEVSEIASLQRRIDEIMLGTAEIDYDEVMMQLDRSDGPDSRPGPQSRGHKGATLAYRKIQNLELDPLCSWRTCRNRCSATSARGPTARRRRSPATAPCS